MSSEIKMPFLYFPWALEEIEICSLVMDEAQFHITQNIGMILYHSNMMQNVRDFRTPRFNNKWNAFS